jgi:hypothetical protein
MMQGDCYLIADDGWYEAAQPKLMVEEKGKKAKMKPDFSLGKKKYQAELIPPTLIIQRWFADDRAAIKKLEAGVAALQQQIEETAEEHGGEEGLLADAEYLGLYEMAISKLAFINTFTPMRRDRAQPQECDVRLLVGCRISNSKGC